MKFLSLPLTSGHPASNGAIENRHKTLKDSLKTALIDMGSKHKEEWPQALPCVLLGRRASHQPDLDASAAHLCLGKLPSLPGQLLGLPGPPLNSIQTKALLEQLYKMSAQPPIQTTSVEAPLDISHTEDATHVYIKSANPKSLCPRFEGPHPRSPGPLGRRFRSESALMQMDLRAFSLSIGRLAGLQE